MFPVCQNGRTALHLAALNGQIEVLQLLIGAKADIEIEDEVISSTVVETFRRNGVPCDKPNVFVGWEESPAICYHGRE